MNKIPIKTILAKLKSQLIGKYQAIDSNIYIFYRIRREIYIYILQDQQEIMYCQDQTSTIQIRLIMVNEADGTSRQLQISLPFFSSTRELRLNEALQDTCQRVMSLYGSQLFYVDFQNRVNRFLGVYPIQQEIRINYQSIVNRSVQINIKPSFINNPSHASVVKQQDIIIQEKVKKVKQRTIQEAVEAVKIWRRLYDTDDGNGKRLYTLDQSARQVGIAKKTLDDYYSLIRAATNFNFNIERFKQSKVGLLRKFVKIAKEEGQQGLNTKMSQYQYDLDIQKYWNISQL